jgi:hypothetical protein
MRRERLLKAPGSIVYAGREIARKELLNIESLGSNEEEFFRDPSDPGSW